MYASALIDELQRLVREAGCDLEVVAQTAGCCNRGHEVTKIEVIREVFGGNDLIIPGGEHIDEDDQIVLRCE